MKSWSHDVAIAAVAFSIWRIFLEVIALNAYRIWQLKLGYLGYTPWANFDGVHYLSIAAYGYHIYQAAFFPLYPWLIRASMSFLPVIQELRGQVISEVSFFVGLVIYLRLQEALGLEHKIWSLVLLLLFPTSYYFASVYTTSLFFLFAVMTMYAIQTKHWIVAGVSTMLSGATQIFGILLMTFFVQVFLLEKPQMRKAIAAGSMIATLGLVAYMLYLLITQHDALAFFHVQPAFGAGRSGGSIILLPQVFFRYGKILASMSPRAIEFQVAAFEMVTFVFGLAVLWITRSTRLTKMYGLYCLSVLILPTLTGTLSSMPRYVLSAFPLFFILTSVHNTRRNIALALLFVTGLVYFASAFFRGYFVA